MSSAPVVLLVHPDSFDIGDIVRDVLLSCPEYTLLANTDTRSEHELTTPVVFVWTTTYFLRHRDAIKRHVKSILIVPTDLPLGDEVMVGEVLNFWQFGLVSYGQFSNIMLREIVEFLNHHAKVDKAEAHG